ncbi:MAG: glycosyltransferase [Clostridia bacterium]|nr:glycosyltransferase [Clostridia bacterium]
MKNKFSILVLLETSENIKEAIFDLVKTINFLDTEIILLDNIGAKAENSELEETLLKYPAIVYIDAKNKNKSEAYNIGIQKATGNYITFIEQGVKYDKGAISNVKKYIEKEQAKIICLKSYYVQAKNTKKYKMSPNINSKINLIIEPLKIGLALEGYFFQKELVEQFDGNIHFEDAKIKFILENLMKCPEYYVVKNKFVYYTTPKEDDTSTNLIQYDKQWYNSSLTDFVIPFLKGIRGEIPSFIQEAMLYYIFAKYNCNSNDRNKMILSREEAKDFFDSTAIALTYIDTDLILQRDKESLYRIPRWIAYQFVLAKNQKLGLETNLKIADEMIYLCDDKDKHLFSQIEDEHITVYAINSTNETIEIDFSVSIQDMMQEKDVSVFVKYNDKIIEATKTDCYPLLKVFGLTIAKKIYFHLSIKAEQKGKIEFYFKYQDKECKFNIKYEKVQAHLNNSRFSYWQINDKYYLCNKRDHLVIEPKRIFSGLWKEVKYFIARIIRAKRIIFALKYFTLRLAYWCVKPFYKSKQIWITFDKLYKAGDNGEYIYRYIKENHPEIKIYYVIKRESLDYKRLKNEKNAHILVYETFKHKLVSLLSTAILDTHANAISYCSFDTKRARSYIGDLFNAEVICIQHGLSIQKIAQYQNRLFDNIKLYCCASQYEIHNLLDNPMYDFRENQIELTGLARYDGLKSNEQRQILITPTWRRNIVNSNVAHIKKDHNTFFKNSKYYQIYNQLINDKKLIETAKKHNYKITYLLHPAISAQKEDFEKNEDVEIIAATDNMNYEKILTEASLMVTDYSGVQFDFAYMRKPIVYYHPNELPPHYDAGGLQYETMGFGPICKTHEEIVAQLCNYMEKNCQIEEEYIKRANDFFAYDDYNNCERIYQSIQNKLIKKNKQEIEEKGVENEHCDYLCRR